MEKQKFYYEEIKFIAAEIGKRNIPFKFIDVAKEGKESKLNKLFEEFKEENSELWERMENMYFSYESDEKPTIFDYGDIIYDSKEINPINLCFVFLFSDGFMDDCDAFLDYEVLQEYLHKYNYPKFAKYLEGHILATVEDLIKVVCETE